MIVKPIYLQCVTLPLLLGYAISELTALCPTNGAAGGRGHIRKFINVWKTEKFISLY